MFARHLRPVAPLPLCSAQTPVKTKVYNHHEHRDRGKNCFRRDNLRPKRGTRNMISYHRNRARSNGDSDSDSDSDSDDDGDANSTTCSVITFEEYHMKITQSTDALSKIERMLDPEMPEINSAEPQRLPAVATIATAAVAEVPSTMALQRNQRRAGRKAQREAKMADKRKRWKKR